MPGVSEARTELQKMNGASPIVSVVLLSYNRPDYLRQAVASILAQSYQHLEMIVVDNPSPASGEIAAVVSAQRNVRLIRNDTNSGFAGGMNRGIENAHGHFIYLTEDDLVLDKHCIRNLVEYMEDHPSGGLVSPVMYNKTEGTIRCAGGEFALGAIYRRQTHGEGQRDTGQFTQAFNVTYVNGATMFARADLFRRLGGFREEFFMYVEDVEFCARVLTSGEPMAVIPQAKVYHFDPPADANASPYFNFHRLKNFFSLYLLHAPARVLPEFFLRYALLNLLRSMVGRGGRPSTLVKALVWVAMRAPALLKERRGRPALSVGSRAITQPAGDAAEATPPPPAELSHRAN